ncbi:MAG TPA: proline dehydrogenase family protein [Actinomycetota bacterium]|nr:proline dehydrogenase family protein [Actinomycetota bacterium]
MSGPLFRAPVLWVANSPIVRRMATGAGPGRRLALRFVAGETLDDGMRVARQLNARGVGAMLDHLGENVTSADRASAAADGYVLALKRLGEEGLTNANISVKLTQLGLDVSEEICQENSHRVLEAAGELGTLVMIDMESFEYVDRTLSIYRMLRKDHPGVGVCVQAYLYRSADDARALAAEGTTVRVCKGAYLEAPTVAFPRKAEVNRSYARLAATLLASGCVVHIATHDERLIGGALRFVERRGIPTSRFEFQMLYGIRRDLQERLVRAGFPVRVYVPYGGQWYPYLTRRLAERPANLWFLASNLIRRGG